MIGNDEHNLVVINAKVISGRGIASKKMTALDTELKNEGIDIYPGTLNTVFAQPIVLNNDTAIVQLKGHLRFWNIKVNGISCMAHRYGKCPFHIVEIVSKHKLRDVLDITNDSIEVQFQKKDIKQLSILQYALWILAWKGRESLFYTSNGYSKFIGKFLNFKNRVKSLF